MPCTPQYEAGFVLSIHRLEILAVEDARAIVALVSPKGRVQIGYSGFRCFRLVACFSTSVMSVASSLRGPITATMSGRIHPVTQPSSVSISLFSFSMAVS